MCTWHDLHKPVVIDASINTNWIAIGILVITQDCFLPSPKGIVENLPTEFQGGVSQAIYVSCKNLLSFTNISYFHGCFKLFGGVWLVDLL